VDRPAGECHGKACRHGTVSSIAGNPYGVFPYPTLNRRFGPLRQSSTPSSARIAEQST
jgi:hypothetical protein